MLQAERLLELETTRRRSYGWQQSRLYALSVGFGSDPMHLAELPFVGGSQERRVVPTMATTFGDVILDLTAACGLSRPDLVLHASQSLEMTGDLLPEDELDVAGRVTAVYDRGEKGALIHMTATATRVADCSPVYRATYVSLARGDGGFGGERPPPAARFSGQRPPPDRSWRHATLPGQALLYALNGDPNPIHLDPGIARRAGFERPILHGLCSYGIACRALLAECCDYDTSRLLGLEARFSAPVVPGETLRVDIWSDASRRLFEVRSEERDVAVIKDGVCALRGNEPPRQQQAPAGSPR